MIKSAEWLGLRLTTNFELATKSGIVSFHEPRFRRRDVLMQFPPLVSQLPAAPAAIPAASTEKVAANAVQTTSVETPSPAPAAIPVGAPAEPLKVRKVSRKQKLFFAAIKRKFPDAPPPDVVLSSYTQLTHAVEMTVDFKTYQKYLPYIPAMYESEA